MGFEQGLGSIQQMRPRPFRNMYSLSFRASLSGILAVDISREPNAQTRVLMERAA